MNLYELIKKHSFQGFSLSVVRRIAIAILRCLRALFEERIIHCDLKPVSLHCIAESAKVSYLSRYLWAAVYSAGVNSLF